MKVHAAECRPNARGQLLRNDWLRDVVVSTSFQPSHQVVRVRLCTHNDDWNDAVRAQSAAHLETRQIGQTKVEQNKVGFVLDKRRETGTAIGCFAHLVALILQRHLQCHSDGIVIFDEQQ